MPQPELWVGGRRILGGNTRYFSRILMLVGSCWCLFICLWAPSKGAGVQGRRACAGQVDGEAKALHISPHMGHHQAMSRPLPMATGSPTQA